MCPSRDVDSQKPLCLTPEDILPEASPTSHLSPGSNLQNQAETRVRVSTRTRDEGQVQLHFTDEDTKAQRD